MPTPANRAGKRGLVAMLAVLVVLLLAFDLLRADSILRSVWNDFFGPRSLLRRFLDGFRRGPLWR